MSATSRCVLLTVGVALLTGPPLLADEPLPDGVLLRLGSPRLRHGGTVRGVAFSPDGRLLASAGDDHTVRLWDATTGEQRHRFDGHLWPVRCVAYCPDGRLLASAGDDRVICLWDAASGGEVRRLEGHDDAVTALAFTADGRRLISGSTDRTVRVWDVRQGTGRSLFTEHPVGAIALAPDGNVLAVADGDGLLFWDIARDRPLHRVPGPWVASLAFAPDGKTVAAGEWGGRVRLWDPVTGNVVRSLAEDAGEIRCLAFSRDGKTLASGGSERVVRLWDVAAGKEGGRLEGHHDTVTALAFSATGGSWLPGRRPHRPYMGPRYRPGGHRYPRPPGRPLVRRLWPDGRSVVTGSRDGTLRLWDAGTGQERRRFAGHQGPVRCAAVAPDGGLLASGGDDQTVRLWDPATGKEVNRLRGHRNQVAAVAFSPDGKLLASGSHDKAMRLWDVSTGGQLQEYPAVPGWIVALTFTRDGKGVVCASTDNAVRVQGIGEARDGRPAELGPHPGGLLTMAATANGWTVATGGKDRHVRLWDLAKRKEWAVLRGHPAWVEALAFAPDGGVLVSGDADGLLCLWDVATGAEVGRLSAPAGAVAAIAFSPGGDRLVTAGADTTALVWSVPELVRAARPHPIHLSDRDLDRLSRELGDADDDRAFQAARSLTAGAGQSVPFLKEQVRPIPADRLAQLLRDLDSSDFPVRDEASRELERYGKLVEPALRRTLEAGPSPEVRRRIDRLLERIAEAPPSKERLQALRALEVLERIGNPKAREVLQALAGGAPDTEVTRQAKAALARLDRRP